MDYPWLPPVLLLLAVVGASLWVLRDARARAQDGRPVVAVVLGLTIDRPQTWAALCLLLFVIALPMYIVARRADS